jgi:hypothetical protein
MKVLRRTLLVHSIVAGVVGLQHLTAPRIWAQWAGITVEQTATWRLVGAALLALAVASWLAYHAKGWAAIRIVVVMEVVWSVLGTAVLLYGILLEDLPAFEWINVALLVGFGVAFALLGMQASSSERVAD